MPVEIVKMSIFESNADVLINPVNCVGVMGAGVAKQFKQHFPQMYESYRKACQQGQVYVRVKGSKVRIKPHVWIHPSRKFVILNLPTKTHWKDPSKYEYIIAGLLWLRKNYFKLSKALGRPIKTIAMPWLGCGLGRLDKQKVLEIIVKTLYDLPSNVIICEY